MTSEAWTRAMVMWQDPDSEDYASEPAILLHLDSAGTIVAQQEERHLTFTEEGALEFSKRLRELVKAKREATV